MCGLTEPQPNERQAVLDRIVDGEHAVILVGDEETEFVIPASQLPDGATEGKWLRVRIEDGAIVENVVDEEATDAARARIGAKLAALRARGRRSSRVRRRE